MEAPIRKPLLAVARDISGKKAGAETLLRFATWSVDDTQILLLQL